MACDAQNCPFPHDVASGRPRLGVFVLRPSPSPRPIPELLGQTDDDLQEKMAKHHSYAFTRREDKETEPKEPMVVDSSRKRKQDQVVCPAVSEQLGMSPGPSKEVPHVKRFKFNMGGGEVSKDYNEAADVLLERNNPDIFHDKQTEVIFMPPVYLPKKPRMVARKRFYTRKQRLKENGRENPKILEGLLGSSS